MFANLLIIAQNVSLTFDSRCALRTPKPRCVECDEASADRNVKVTHSAIAEERNEDAELTIVTPREEGVLQASDEPRNPSPRGKMKGTRSDSNDSRSVSARCTPISSVLGSPVHVEVRRDIPTHLRPKTETQAEFLSNLQSCSPQRLQQVAAMMDDLL